MTITGADVTRVLDLERELQSPGTRANVDRLTELLAPNFIEVGVSGRRWDLAATLSMLAQESSEGEGEDIGISGMHARALTADVIQVFWDSERHGRRARRTSLWQRNAHGWQQTYHQGTPLP